MEGRGLAILHLLSSILYSYACSHFRLGKRSGFFTFEVMIHPTAIVHAKAKLDSTVRVGPYAIIDEGVEIGPDCELGPHVYITGLTKIGSHNHFHAGSVIGD